MIEGLPELAAELRRRAASASCCAPSRARHRRGGARTAREPRDRATRIRGARPSSAAASSPLRLACRSGRSTPTWSCRGAMIGREHWAARTIRPRIHEQLERFLVADARGRAPTCATRSGAAEGAASRRPTCSPDFAIDHSVAPSTLFHGGERRRAHAAAGIRARRAERLRRAPQPPRARRHEPALALPALRPARSARGRAGGARRRRAQSATARHSSSS